MLIIINGSDDDDDDDDDEKHRKHTILHSFAQFLLCKFTHTRTTMSTFT